LKETDYDFLKIRSPLGNDEYFCIKLRSAQGGSWLLRETTRAARWRSEMFYADGPPQAAHVAA